MQLLEKDWLSGLSTDDGQNSSPSKAGHFSYTYPSDTYAQPQIRTLSGYTQGIAFMMLVPSIMLFGYQIMLGLSTFQYAGAAEGLSHILLGGLAVAVSPLLIEMLINLEGTTALGIISLHYFHGYPGFLPDLTNVDPKAPPFYLLDRVNLRYIDLYEQRRIPYLVAALGKDGEYGSSYQGLIQPISRWGCAINDFIGIFSQHFITNSLGSVFPLLGGVGHLADPTSAPVTPLDLVHRSAAMLLTVLSMFIFIQVVLRIIFLNYYIITAPLACSCWALPAGVGQRVMALWFKGFILVLFVQVAQLFVMSVLPLMMPPFPSLPSSTDKSGTLQALFLEFQPILTVCLTLIVPRILGASITQAFGIAGAIAKEAFRTFL
jgi:hypothetical protein